MPSNKNDTDHRIDFDAPAILRKWPSLKNERRAEGTSPYLVVDGTLNECIRSFMAKPVSMRHLYGISHVAAASSSGGGLIWRDRCGTCPPKGFSLIAREGAYFCSIRHHGLSGVRQR